MSEPIPGRVHQHFKGDDKKYLVVAVSTSVDPPHKQIVVYVPLYGENAGCYLHRDLEEWESDVSRKLESGQHYDGPRFWPLPPQGPNLS